MPCGVLSISPTLHFLKATILLLLYPPIHILPRACPHGNPVFPWVSSLLWAAVRVSRLLIPHPKHPLLPTPLHTHQLPWQAFCQFLDAWNQGQDWKRRWRRQRNFIDTQGTQASQHSFFSCTNYGAVPSCPRVSPGWLSIILLMLYCAIVLKEITLLPKPETLPITWP